MLVLDHINVVAAEMVEAGDWDLDGAVHPARRGDRPSRRDADRDRHDRDAVRGVHATPASCASELQRLFLWLKDRGVTAVITAERGEGTLTRHGIEEYVSDCVIVLDHLVTEETSTRRLRVLKYRGSLHGTNEYPFLIGERGISVQPITSLGLRHGVSNERVSTGVDRLDVMLGGAGPYRGSSVLVSGTAGTGKSTLAAQFCDAACARGERAIYFAFEESQEQIIRNMGSVGMDLGRWVEQGLLRFRCVRPSLLGLEAHLAAMQTLVEEFDPAVVVLDPISDLIGTGGATSTRDAHPPGRLPQGPGRDRAVHQPRPPRARTSPTDQLVASLIDTWLLAAHARGQRRAQPRAVGAQVPRHGRTPIRSASFSSPTGASSWPTSTSARRAC